MHFLDASYVNDKTLISIKKQKEKRKKDSPRSRRTLFWPFLIAIAFHSGKKLIVTKHELAKPQAKNVLKQG